MFNQNIGKFLAKIWSNLLASADICFINGHIFFGWSSKIFNHFLVTFVLRQVAEK